LRKIIFSILLVTSAIHAGEPLVPPPLPAIAPQIATQYPNDADGDHVADDLAQRCQQALAKKTAAVLVASTNISSPAPDAAIDLELIFSRPITQSQIDTFLQLGGSITYIYKAVSYGWNGRLPLAQVNRLPALLGDSLVLVEESKPVVLHMDHATRTGRVRPVWSPGFVGSALGFSGNTNITVAIVDSGMDASHTDLAGRRVYWQDFSTDAVPNPVDYSQHGTHVGAVAVGTGAASGSATGPLLGTLYGSLSGIFSNNFVVTPMLLPTNTINFTATVRWNGGGNGTLELLSHNQGTKAGWTVEGAGVSGTSPLSLNVSVTGNPAREYSPALVSNGSMTDYVITYQVPQYPGGDNFNRLSGVAPRCNWAAAKVFATNGSSLLSWTAAAVDDLVANRVADNIKVMNLSLGTTGSPGISTTTRQKVNTAVNNGIVVTVSAGNNGLLSPASAREISDPGRAAMVLTVAAANDVNQLTDYSSQGFGSPTNTVGQEEDYKPDLMAPGGSSYYSDILAADSNSGDGTAFPDQQPNDYWSIQGTSVAAPFAAGCAALVVDALQQSGVTWDFSSAQFPLLVKMLLCATATESNTNRESLANNPTVQRAANGTNGFPSGKDQFEGYGMINPDAAVEAVSQKLVFGSTNNFSLGATTTDARAWACQVSLAANVNFSASLTVPGTGDFDLYLYSAIPGLFGKPVILAASTQAGNGVNESLSYQSSTNATAYLVVKRVSGAGAFSLVGNVPPQLAVVPASFDYGLLATGGSAPATFVVSNAGAGILTGTIGLQTAGGFSILSGTPFSLGAFGATNVTIQFSPQSRGSYSNAVVVASNGGSASSVLTGRAADLPMLSVAVGQSPLAFSFATTVGCTYVIQSKTQLTDPVWQTVQTQAGDGTTHVFSAPPSGVPQTFYRVCVQ